MKRTPIAPQSPAGALRRRDLLRTVPALGAATLAPAGLGACGDDDDAPGGGAFRHGVASGDPLPDGVILWTRVSGASGDAVEVTWVVASDPALTQIVQMGTAAASAARDFTVKVDVRGLAAGQTYYYRFRTDDDSSPVGRTRTAPTGPVARARFAVASCASYAQGYFHGYRSLARRADLDAVIHLGDYIYEYGAGDFGTDRAVEPVHETVTLADYRLRHAAYKLNPDLQEAHRQHPFIVVWDDHETANNAWKDGAQNHMPATEGAWADRKAAGQRAYLEWMPLREQPGGEGGVKIWRKLVWGDLADIVLLDTRLWARSESNPAIVAMPPPDDPGRTLLGDDQAAWLEQQISTSTARWKLVGQQVMVANLIVSPGMLVNLDQWQGYPSSRRRLLEFLGTPGISDVVMLTGDIHSSWAAELTIDPNDPAGYDPATSRGAAAVEFVTPGITSPGLPPSFNGFIEGARPYNPHMRWFDLVQQGYLILDVTPERLQGAWYLFADIKRPVVAAEVVAAAWSVKAGTPRLEKDEAPAAAPEGPLLAP